MSISRPAQIRRKLVTSTRALTALLFAGIFGVLGIGQYSAPVQASTGINKTINYQGRLLTAGGAVVPDGNYNVVFRIYQDGAGTAAWNGGTSGSPTGIKWTEIWQNSIGTGSSGPVVVHNGYFSVALGTYCAFTGGSCQGNTNAGVDWNQSVLWLSVQVDVAGTSVSNTPTYDPEMLPMRRLSSAVYALQADNASKLGGLSAANFIQNVAPNTTQQTGNINILSGAASTVAAAEIQQVSSPTAPVLILKGGASPGVGADLLQLQNSSGTTLARFNSAGNLSVASTIDTQTATTLTVGGTATAISLAVNTTLVTGKNLTVTAGTVSLTGPSAGSSTAVTVVAGANSNVPLAVQLGASPSANAFEIQNSGGTPIAYFDSTGDLHFRNAAQIKVGTNPSAAAGDDLDIQAGTAGGGVNNGGNVNINGGTASGGGNKGHVLLQTGSGLVGVGTTSPTAKLHVTQVNASIPSLITQGASGQSVDLLQYQDVNGNIFGAFNSTGNQLTLGTVAASVSSAVTAANPLAGVLRFGDGALNQYTHNLSVDTLSASYTSKLPGAIGSTGQCLSVASVVSTTQTLGYTGCANLSLSNLSGPTAINTDLTFAAADRQLTVATQGSSGVAGNKLTVISAVGNGAGAGGILNLTGGTGGSSGAGGAVKITGGAAGGGTAAGGNVTLSGGAKAGSGTPGSVIVKPQTSNDSTTAFMVQNAAGKQLLTVDSSGANIIIGQTGGSGVTGNLQLANASNSNLVTIQAQTTSSSYTLQLPTAVATTGDCLKSGTVAGSVVPLTFASCATNVANVTLSNLSGPTAINTDLTFAAADRQLTIATQGTVATAGNTLTIQAATGNTSGAGGALHLQGGTGGATGAGGAVTITGGAAGGGTTAGGNVTLSGGAKAGSGTGGSVIIKPQASNDSATAFQVQDAAGTTNLLTVDSTNSRIYVGPTAGNTTGVLLVVGVKTTASDPTEVDGAIYYNSSSGGFRCGTNAGWRSCMGGLAFSNLAPSTAISNTVTLTNFTTDTNSNTLGYTMLANDCQPGVTYLITATGLYSMGGTGNTFKLFLDLDGTATNVLSLAGFPTVAATPTNWGWRLEAQLICVSTGVSGTLEAQGATYIQNSTVGSVFSNLSRTTTLTYDSTSSHTVYAGLQWSAAAASNTATLRQIIIQRLGP